MKLAVNERFKMKELESVLQTKNSSAPGEDNIGYQVYKNLPVTAKEKMLNLINQIWETGEIPAACKHSILIPILKQNKDPTKTTSYRPIALTSCFMKIMESMVKRRLQFFLGKHDILSPIQNGFRKGRCTIDNIIHLENDIQKNLETSVKTLAVFIDLEKAFDSLWTKGLLVKLSNLGLKGHILLYLHNLLSRRTFQVRIGRQVSCTMDINNGLPQGSTLSPILFNVMLHDIPVSPAVHNLLYADDCVIWKSGNDLRESSKHNIIQDYLNVLNEWFSSWGLNISHEKTVPMLFSRSTREEQFLISLNENILAPRKEHKYLGVIFDSRLTWKPHIQNIVQRCKKKINILKCIAHAQFCNNVQEILQVYRAIIRSIMDYACEAYDSASTNVKNILNSVQYQSLLVCAGAKKGTSLRTLQVELGEMPLDLRREMFSIKLKRRIDSIPNHPLAEDLTDCWQFNIYKDKNTRQPFGQRVIKLPDILTYNVEEIFTTTPIPPWHYDTAPVSTELSQIISKSDNALFQRQRSLELINQKWANHLHIFTDGSKFPDTGNASAAFFVPYYEYVESKRLQNNTSSYRAELAAIALALYWLHQLPSLYTGAVIFCDSLGAIEALKNNKEEQFIYEILMLYTQLHYNGVQVYFEWIPGHCEIQANEVADKAAKHALTHTQIEIKNKQNKNESNSILKLYYMQKWQRRWDETVSPLKSIQKSVSATFKFVVNHKSGETILHCLRMDNIGLNQNLLLLNKHATGLCDNCGVPETTTHFLAECPRYIIERSMLLVEINRQEERNIERLLTSSENIHQKALVAFVRRTQRFPFM